MRAFFTAQTISLEIRLLSSLEEILNYTNKFLLLISYFKIQASSYLSDLQDLFLKINYHLYILVYLIIKILCRLKDLTIVSLQVYNKAVHCKHQITKRNVLSSYQRKVKKNFTLVNP